MSFEQLFKPSPASASMLRVPDAAKQSEPAEARAAVPTLDELGPNAKPANLDGASTGVLIFAIEERLEAWYANIKRVQDSVLKLLSEPPPPEDISFAMQVLALLAQGLAGFALGHLGSTILTGLKSRASEATVDATKGVLTNFTRSGSQAAGKTFDTAIGHVRKLDGGAVPTSIIRKPLLDAFAGLQQRALDNAHHEARTRVAAVQDVISRVNNADLKALADALWGAETDDDASAYELQVVTGWMNFCASLSLGRQGPNEATAMPGANQVHGLERAGDSALRTWLGPHQGFIDIAIRVPDPIHGIRGLELEAVGVESENPGLADALRLAQKPLLSLPVFRRVSLRSARGTLFDSTPLVITPEGAREVDVASYMLSAIGRARPLEVQEGWLGGRAGTDDKTSAPTAGEAVNADYAQQGAAMVTSWLAQFTTKVIK